MAFIHSPKVITDGLVLYYDAANRKSYPESGTTWTDVSGNGYSGSLTNGPTFDGSNGGNVVFDGVNDYVNSGLNKTSIGGTITIFMWVYCTGAQSSRGIFAIADSLSNANPWISLERTNSTQVRWFVNENLRITHSVSDSIYTNLALTFVGTTWTGYKNGLSDGTYGPNNIGAQPGSTTWLGNGYGGYFSGRIPLFSVYTRPLSATEVLQNYNATRGRFGL